MPPLHFWSVSAIMIIDNKLLYNFIVRKIRFNERIADMRKIMKIIDTVKSHYYQERTYLKEGEYLRLALYSLEESIGEICIDTRHLRKKEISRVREYFLTGSLHNIFISRRVRKCIQDNAATAVRLILDHCFGNGDYDPVYTTNLIVRAIDQHSCTERCGYAEAVNAVNLYKEYLNGNSAALTQLKDTLADFFLRTKPFYFTPVAEN